MQLYYLLGLIGGLVGMGIIDYRLKLALWHDRKRTLLTIAIAVGIFTIWDILGILLKIFYAGPSPYFLTLRLLPQFPVEEVFLLDVTLLYNINRVPIRSKAMMTYLLLNCIVIVIVCLALIKGMRKPSKAEVLTLLVLLALTAVFDNVIVGLGIVSYDPQKYLGIFIGKAPVEDFMYALLAVIIVPALWRLIGESRHD